MPTYAYKQTKQFSSHKVKYKLFDLKICKWPIKFSNIFVIFIVKYSVTKISGLNLYPSFLTMTKMWMTHLYKDNIKMYPKTIFGVLCYITYTNKKWSYENTKHDPSPKILYLNIAILASEELLLKQRVSKDAANLQITDQ